MDWKINGVSCLKDGVPTLKCALVVFDRVIEWAFILAGTVAVIFIIWAGIQYIRSGGDQKQVQGARNTLTYAIIGLVLILLSFFIIYVISYLTNTPCIRRFGFNQCSTYTPRSSIDPMP